MKTLLFFVLFSCVFSGKIESSENFFTEERIEFIDECVFSLEDSCCQIMSAQEFKKVRAEIAELYGELTH